MEYLFIMSILYNLKTFNFNHLDYNKRILNNYIFHIIKRKSIFEKMLIKSVFIDVVHIYVKYNGKIL